MKATSGLNPSTAETRGAAVCLRHLGGRDKRIGSRGSSSTHCFQALLGQKTVSVWDAMRFKSTFVCFCSALWDGVFQHPPGTGHILSPSCQEDSRCASPCPAPILQQYLCVTFRTRQNYSCLYSEISNKWSILDLKHSFLRCYLLEDSHCLGNIKAV